MFRGVKSLKEVFPSISPEPDWTRFIPSTITVYPTPELPLDFTITQVVRTADETTLYGRSKSGAHFVSVASKTALMANVELTGVVEFQVFARGDKASVLEIPANELKCLALPAQASIYPGAQNGSSVANEATESPSVDILLFYTSEVEEDAANFSWSNTESGTLEYITLYYKSQLAIANQSLANSKIHDFTWRIVTALKFPEYAYERDMENDLLEIAGRSQRANAKWANQLADSVGADQLLLVTGATRNYGGLAYMPGYEAVLMSQQGWGTMAHELGHNFGCDHDRKTAGKLDTDFGRFNFAHRWTIIQPTGWGNFDWGTIMGYESKVRHFSNPDVTVDMTEYQVTPGQRVVVSTGSKEGLPNAAHNARTIREHAATLINRRKAVIQKPVLLQQPVSQSKPFGEPRYLEVSAYGGSLSYQWRRYGVAIEGATSPYLKFFEGGEYDVVVSNTEGVTTSEKVSIIVEPVLGSPGRIINISTRSYVGAGMDAQIAGIVIAGKDPKKLLIRASGPALADLGLAGSLEDPKVSVYRGQELIYENDDWGTSGATVEEFEETCHQTGAFAFKRGSKDAGSVLSLPTGTYSVIVSGSGKSGLALVEIYEIGRPEPKLLNISTRSIVQTDANVMIAGFIIDGNAPKTVIVRAVGPGLKEHGLTEVLEDPVLELYRGSTKIYQNNDWSTDHVLASQAEEISSRVGAFALKRGSKDSALVVTLDPGTYSAIVSGSAATSGIALVEIYEVN